MKKQSRILLFLWFIIAAVFAGGAFLISSHVDKNIVSPSGSSASSTVASSASMQSFSGDGYEFNVPANWQIEQTGKDSVAVHPDVTCKIEMSVFPYSPDMDMADWISKRIGADPSLAVSEQSSGDVSINGGTGVRWNGMIDRVPTTLIYAFSDSHAYEIAPSVANGAPPSDTGGGNAPCEDALDAFISQLILQ